MTHEQNMIFYSIRKNTYALLDEYKNIRDYGTVVDKKKFVGKLRIYIFGLDAEIDSLHRTEDLHIQEAQVIIRGLEDTSRQLKQKLSELETIWDGRP